MSAKAVFYGLPEAVVDKALALGVHPDCLRWNPRNNAITPPDPECARKVYDAIDAVYAHITTPADRLIALGTDTEREQADG